MLQQDLAGLTDVLFLQFLQTYFPSPQNGLETKHLFYNKPDYHQLTTCNLVNTCTYLYILHWHLRSSLFVLNGCNSHLTAPVLLVPEVPDALEVPGVQYFPLDQHHLLVKNNTICFFWAELNNLGMEPVILPRNG